MALLLSDGFDDVWPADGWTAPTTLPAALPKLRRPRGAHPRDPVYVDDVIVDGPLTMVLDPTEDMPLRFEGATMAHVGQCWMMRVEWGEWRLAIFRDLAWTVYAPQTIRPRKRGRRPVRFIPTLGLAPWLPPITLTEHGWGHRRLAEQRRRPPAIARVLR